MHANRFCCFLVLLPVCSALRHTSCSASGQARAIENQEGREDEPPTSFFTNMFWRTKPVASEPQKPTAKKTIPSDDFVVSEPQKKTATKPIRPDEFEGNGSQASNIYRDVASQKWAVAVERVSVWEKPGGKIRKRVRLGYLHLGMFVEVDGPERNGWLKINFLQKGKKYEGYVRQVDNEPPPVRPILEAPSTSSFQVATDITNWFKSRESVLKKEIPESQRPDCADVYNALLGDKIDVPAWNQPLVDYDRVLKPFLEAIDDPTNPLFVGASPLEHIKWKWGNIPLLVEIVFPVPQNVMVIGDIHGRLGSLRKAHEKWKRSKPLPYVVMTGDMVDRGNRQVEVAAALLAWRCQFPDRVMVLHGNHEDQINMAYGLQCADFVGPFENVASNPNLFERLNSIFRKMPTALVIKQPHPYEAASGVFMHGSFGPKAFEASSSQQAFDIEKEEVYTKISTEMKWNERNVDKDGDNCRYWSHNRTTWFQDSARGGGTKVFCPRIGFHFLRNLGVCNFFTGHSHFNKVHQTVEPQESYDGNMEDPRAVASLAWCSEMNHVVTLSAHKFNVEWCRHYDVFDQHFSAEKAEKARDGCQGKVTMVRPHADPDLGQKIISQENLFGEECKEETREAWALDIGVSGGRYPDIMGGIFPNQVGANQAPVPKRDDAFSEEVLLQLYYVQQIADLYPSHNISCQTQRSNCVKLPPSELFCSVYKSSRLPQRGLMKWLAETMVVLGKEPDELIRREVVAARWGSIKADIYPEWHAEVEEWLEEAVNKVEHN